MKKVFSITTLVFVAMMSFAQDAATQSSAAQTEGESIPVNSVFLVMGVAMVSLFLFTIIYSLAKAVRALSSQVNTKA